jgi:methionyl-tRNA formyltransferase
MTIENIFFIGNGHGAIAALKSLQNTFTRIGIFSEDANLKKLCRSNDFIYEHIDDISINHGVMAGYIKILPKNFLENKFLLNIHYSLLPHLRGLHSVVWAILNGDKKIGWSVHLVDDGVDTGRIYYQSSLMYQNETSWEVMNIFNLEVEKVLGGIAKNIFNGSLIGWDQDSDHATWVAKRNLEDCLVDFSKSIEEIRRFFLALVRPYPLPAIIFRGQRFEISNCNFLKRDYLGGEGRIVNIDELGVYIKCKDGLLIVNELIDDANISCMAKDILPLGARL